jgi:putative tryptophan/tyrosine transport system substrate-binding protein
MGRRECIRLLGAVAASWPLSALSQPARVPRIAILMAYASSDKAGQLRLNQILQGLERVGWTAGRNVEIEVRWPGANTEQIQNAARELVAGRPEVIVSTSTTTTAAARRETATIPIIFTIVSDPVGESFVSSLARPDGNITGFINYEASMAGKWLELLKEVDVRIVRAAGLFNPEFAPRKGTFFAAPFEAAARSMGVLPLVTPVRSEAEIEAAISMLGSEAGGGLIMMADNFMATHRKRFIELAAFYKLPSIFPFRAGPADGGLLSYGPDFCDFFKSVGPYVDRILKGTKVNELPVQMPAKFELVINLRTAKVLGLDLPATLLGRADEVIE